MNYGAYARRERRTQQFQASVYWLAVTRERLVQQYGVERAAMIEAGLDPATQADLAAWKRLGREAAA